MNLAMYILVNQDIKIGKGKLAGQVGHAVATYFYRGKYTKELMDEYMKEQKKIILSCNQERLEELEREGHIAIRDLGLTQLEKGTLTCVNLGIIDRDEGVPEFVGKLKLYSK